MEYKLKNPLHATIGTTKYQCAIEWRNGKFIADEPVSSGGQDIGPDPYTLLLSSLASCTLVTMRMYIERKGWDIPEIKVNVNMFQTKKDDVTTTIIDRDIYFPLSVEKEKKDRLIEIAKSCPVSKILEGDIKVRSFQHHEEDVEKKLKYSNNEITVVWKPGFCEHAGRCVTQLPSVFNLKAHPWINAHGADTNTIIAQVNRCPTGALSYFQNSTPAAGTVH